ncbi:hypothetical protein V2A60_002249 [Cordyceps javanica]
MLTVGNTGRTEVPFLLDQVEKISIVGELSNTEPTMSVFLICITRKTYKTLSGLKIKFTAIKSKQSDPGSLRFLGLEEDLDIRELKMACSGQRRNVDCSKIHIDSTVVV